MIPEATSPIIEPALAPVMIRSANANDRKDVVAVCSILVEAFPTLYQWTFGKLPPDLLVALLTALYQAGCLDLSDTRVAQRGEDIVGVALLHVSGRVGKGTVLRYGSVVFKQLSPFKALTAFIGGIVMNLMLSSRIPCADDLVYIEALAVKRNERGHGIGTLLLTDAIRWAADRSRPRLALHVLQRNEGARRLYTRFGFALTQPEPEATPPASQRGQWVSLLMIRTS